MSLVEALVLLVKASKAVVDECPSLGAQWPMGGEGSLERLYCSRVVLVLLFAGEHAAVFDPRRFLEVLDRRALGGDGGVFEFVLGAKASLWRSRLLLPKQTGRVVEGRRVERGGLFGEHHLLVIRLVGSG